MSEPVDFPKLRANLIGTLDFLAHPERCASDLEFSVGLDNVSAEHWFLFEPDESLTHLYNPLDLSKSAVLSAEEFASLEKLKAVLGDFYDRIPDSMQFYFNLATDRHRSRYVRAAQDALDVFTK